jgi:hypothetical protein
LLLLLLPGTLCTTQLGSVRNQELKPLVCPFSILLAGMHGRVWHLAVMICLLHAACVPAFLASVISDLLLQAGHVVVVMYLQVFSSLSQKF